MKGPASELLSLQKIREEFAPYLSVPDVHRVLQHYQHYSVDFRFDQVADHYVLLFPRAGLGDVFLGRFPSDVSAIVSAGGEPGVALIHECFKGKIVMIPKEVAIRHHILEEDPK